MVDDGRRRSELRVSGFVAQRSEHVREERTERLTVNPTLTVLQHPYQICAYVRAQARGPAPAAGDEMALLWRHPRQLTTFFIEARERVLSLIWGMAHDA